MAEANEEPDAIEGRKPVVLVLGLPSLLLYTVNFNLQRSVLAHFPAKMFFRIVGIPSI